EPDHLADDGGARLDLDHARVPHREGVDRAGRCRALAALDLVGDERARGLALAQSAVDEQPVEDLVRAGGPLDLEGPRVAPPFTRGSLVYPHAARTATRT